MIEKEDIAYEKHLYEGITGKPLSSRQPLSVERLQAVCGHFRKIDDACSSDDDMDFDHAFCAVLDMYEAFLDAAYDLSSDEIDELCCFLFRTRASFDLYVRIAVLQKQTKPEIDRGREEGKPWAFDPNLQSRFA